MDKPLVKRVRSLVPDPKPISVVAVAAAMAAVETVPVVAASQL